MRLNIPTDITSAAILDGPGTTQLLAAWIELDRIKAECKKPGYVVPSSSSDILMPKLRFTLENPNEGQPFRVTIELSKAIRKDAHGYYLIDGGINHQSVRAKYRLKKDENGRCGLLASTLYFR